MSKNWTLLLSYSSSSISLTFVIQMQSLVWLRFKLLLPFALGLVTLARQGGNCWECKGVYGTSVHPWGGIWTSWITAETWDQKSFQALRRSKRKQAHQHFIRNFLGWKRDLNFASHPSSIKKQAYTKSRPCHSLPFQVRFFIFPRLGSQQQHAAELQAALTLRGTESKAYAFCSTTTTRLLALMRLQPFFKTLRRVRSCTSGDERREAKAAHWLTTATASSLQAILLSNYLTKK